MLITLQMLWGIAFNDAFFFKQRADTNARKLRGFTAVSFSSSYVFNINKTNASPLLSYMVRGVEQMLQRKKKKLSLLPD